MVRHFSKIKRYIWMLVVCTLLALVSGVIVDRLQHQSYQVLAKLLVDKGAPGTNFPGATIDYTDNIAQATNDAAEITTRSVMDYVSQFDPNLAAKNYTSDELLHDISASTPSTTNSTIIITATAATPDDAVLLANDVAKGYQAYKQQQVQQQLDGQRKSLQDQIQLYTQQKVYWEGKIRGISSTTSPEYAIYTNNLTDVTHTLETLQATQLQLPTKISSNVFVVQLPERGDATSLRKDVSIIALSTGVGLLLGIFSMLLTIFLDNRVFDDDIITKQLGMSYIGGIFESKETKNDLTPGNDRTARQFTDIATNLRLTGILPNQNQIMEGAVLLVTSAREVEGKTTVASGLATMLAQGGNTVIVIDANIRYPAAHVALGIPNNSFGLSELLVSTDLKNLNNAIVRSSIPGVWLLPAGAAMQNPSIALERRLPEIISVMRSKADVIIIDGSALLSNADAAFIGTVVDGIALVIDAKHSRVPTVKRAKDLLQSLTKVPVGAILNRQPFQKRDYYYATTPANMPIEPEQFALLPIRNRDKGRRGDGIRTSSDGPSSLFIGMQGMKQISSTPEHQTMSTLSSPFWNNMKP